MLVLSRKKDERLVLLIPGRKPIWITQVEVRGDKSRLGIEADSDIEIHREEVYEAIKREGSKGK